MKVMVVGASGMLGSAVYKIFGQSDRFQVFGTLRSTTAISHLGKSKKNGFITGVDVENPDSLTSAFSKIQPDIVINCVGVIKQLESAKSPLVTIPINSLLPHRLYSLSRMCGARLFHISTDCVFTGQKGMYKESDHPDAKDLYGLSKYLGEISEPGAITLRTSIIGEELFNGANGLIGWFLNQSGSIKGYRNAVFSGLPTVVLARFIRDYLINRPDIEGLYHLSADPINKFDLLNLVKKTYQKDIAIIPDDGLVIDRSLDSQRLKSALNLDVPSWPQLIEEMRAAHHTD